MTIEETTLTDKGELSSAAVLAIETLLKEKGLQLAVGSDDGIHEAVWDALERTEIIAA